MPNLAFNVLLFLSSYSPVFLIFAIRSACSSTTLSVVFGALFVGSITALIVYLRMASRKAPYTLEVVSVEARDADVAAYAATYLLPFVTAFSADWSDLISLAIFFGVIGAIYVNSRMIFVNPILSLLHFHLHLALLRQPQAPDSAFLDRRADTSVFRRYVLSRERYLEHTNALRVTDLTPEAVMHKMQKEPE